MNNPFEAFIDVPLVTFYGHGLFVTFGETNVTKVTI
jgi:hypothetical protein